MATSMSTFRRYGLTTPRRLVTTIETMTTLTCRRYGRKKPAMRRTVRPRRSCGTGVKSLPAKLACAAPARAPRPITRRWWHSLGRRPPPARLADGGAAARSNPGAASRRARGHLHRRRQPQWHDADAPHPRPSQPHRHRHGEPLPRPPAAPGRARATTSGAWATCARMPPWSALVELIYSGELQRRSRLRELSPVLALAHGARPAGRTWRRACWPPTAASGASSRPSCASTPIAAARPSWARRRLPTSPMSRRSSSGSPMGGSSTACATRVPSTSRSCVGGPRARGRLPVPPAGPGARAPGARSCSLQVTWAWARRRASAPDAARAATRGATGCCASRTSSWRRRRRSPSSAPSWASSLEPRMLEQTVTSQGGERRRGRLRCRRRRPLALGHRPPRATDASRGCSARRLAEMGYR